MDTPRKQQSRRSGSAVCHAVPLDRLVFPRHLGVSLGSLRHGVRFFDILRPSPTRRVFFFGVEGSMQRILFGMVCVACLLSPLLPQWRPSRGAWLASLAPLALMVICGALLYSKTSAEFFSTPADANSLAAVSPAWPMTWCIEAAAWSPSTCRSARGGYLGFAGSLLAAVQGLRQFRRQAACRRRQCSRRDRIVPGGRRAASPLMPAPYALSFGRARMASVYPLG